MKKRTNREDPTPGNALGGRDIGDWEAGKCGGFQAGKDVMAS